MNRGAWAMLIALSVLWGGSFLFVKIAVETMSPVAVVFWRVSLATLCLFAYLRWRRVNFHLLLPFVSALLVMGLLNNVVPFTLLFWGQTQISVGHAAILIAMTPMFTAFLAHILTTDEKLNLLKSTGLVLGVFGVAVMLSPEWTVGDMGLNAMAQAACLAAALSYASAVIWGRRLGPLPPSLATLGQLTASTLIMLPVVILLPIELMAPSITLEAYLSVVSLAILSTAVAFILYFRILQEAGPTNLSLVTLLVPVSAVILEAVFLGTRLGFHGYVGFLLIALGLIFIDGRLPRLLRAGKP